MKINDFAKLLLAQLAKESKLFDKNNEFIKIVALPSNYKQIIENILCAQNNWINEFSDLINISEYFEDHFAWEFCLSLAIEEELQKLGKTVEYDFVQDQILIPFNQDEISDIFNQFNDENIKIKIDHFESLLVDYIYSRRFQERYHDYSANAVRTMHQLQKDAEDLTLKRIINRN
ncbi:MAG: hypothetical protein E7172_01620 [Firmicutes bacterium]|nr:hypothetical protein [Bacillota bacterium]